MAVQGGIPPVALTALILAGGQSRRMGQDKALLPWRGVPLLQRVCEGAIASGATVAILSPWADRYRPQLPQGSEYHWLGEREPGSGPLVAFADGLAQLEVPPDGWIWLLACDLPRLDPAVIQPWRDRLPALGNETLALVPYHDQPPHWEPLCGFYRPACLTPLRQFLAQGGRSFQSWLPTLPAQPLPLTPAQAPCLWNCNTPADMER